MAWRPHGHARVDPRSPSAFGVCDRDGMLYNLKDLRWQFGWVGNALINLNLLVCKRCYDVPNEQLRSRILPPDPVSVTNPRPEAYTQEDLGESAQQSTTQPTRQIWTD